MPRRVVIADRVIIHERIPIPCHRPLRGRGHNRIRLRETAQRRIHPTRLEPVNSQAGFLALTGEPIVGVERAGQITRLTEGFVQRFANRDSVGVGR